MKKINKKILKGISTKRGLYVLKAWIEEKETLLRTKLDNFILENEIEVIHEMLAIRKVYEILNQVIEDKDLLASIEKKITQEEDTQNNQINLF